MKAEKHRKKASVSTTLASGDKQTALKRVFSKKPHTKKTA